MPGPPPPPPPPLPAMNMTGSGGPPPPPPPMLGGGGENVRANLLSAIADPSQRKLKKVDPNQIKDRSTPIVGGNSKPSSAAPTTAARREFVLFFLSFLFCWLSMTF